MGRDIQYADSDGVQIAYEVFGSGPRDLVFVHGWVTHLELMWDQPRVARSLERLGSFCRVINFDKRGTGLSDRGGLAVHIAARVAAQAGPGEVLTSRTVKDLVAGSGIEFTSRGTRELKGVPGEWELYTAS